MSAGRLPAKARLSAVADERRDRRPCQRDRQGEGLRAHDMPVIDGALDHGNGDAGARRSDGLGWMDEGDTIASANLK
jgi:hypothetical protein